MSDVTGVPTWLPALLIVDPWDIDTYQALYVVFCSQIRDSVLEYRGNEVWFYRDEIVNGKELLFWHLTSREDKASDACVPRRKRKFATRGTLRPPDRLPDLRRCERLCWVNPVISHWYAGDVLDWDYLEGDGITKTYLWLKDHNFIVIMKCFSDGRRRLITSYYVDDDWMRADFQRKHDQRIT